jgi:hypothetical protein
MEETLVVAIVAVLLALALPAAKQLFNTLQTPAGVKAMIGSALASARAIAAKEQQHVGIRFQHAYYKDDAPNSPLKTPQYMIYVIFDYEKTGLVDGFRAVEGIEPIKLPENIGVMDLVINDTDAINSDSEIDYALELVDTTTFSVVFSPAGKLVVMQVQTRNRDGVPNLSTSEDDIINTEVSVRAEIARFLQDAEPPRTTNTLDQNSEPSRRSFIIYDRTVLRSLPAGERYTRYLEDLAQREMIYINPYTGTFINR